MENHDVCGARQQVWDWIRSYTKPGTVYNQVKPLRECPICEIPELSHILYQLLWYYIGIGESTDLCLPSMADIRASARKSTVATLQVGTQPSSAGGDLFATHPPKPV